MPKTALIYHPDYLLHNAGSGHPERKERLTATLDYLREKNLLDKVDLLTPEAASEEDLLRVHTKEHVNFIQQFSQSGGMITPDTLVSKNTYKIARLAAGGDILAGKTVMEGKHKNAFALVRPPGHHASSNQAGGFCYFNNVAIAIRYLQKKFSLEKIFLLDWDTHAFNGTAEIFYQDSSVLDVSLHQDPSSFYPGTGFMEEIGSGEGKGFTVNIPLKAGSQDADYLYIFHEFMLPLIDSFRPELVVISAGQDSHRDDFISGIHLTEEGYGEMTRLMVKKAEEHCQGRLFVELEGGYELDALKKSNYEIMKGLLGEREEKLFPGQVLESSKELILSLENIFKGYHQLS